MSERRQYSPAVWANAYSRLDDWRQVRRTIAEAAARLDIPLQGSANDLLVRVLARLEELSAPKLVLATEFDAEVEHRLRQEDGVPDE